MEKYVIIGGGGWPQTNIVQASLSRGLTVDELREMLKDLPGNTRILVQTEGRLFGGTSGRVVTK